jgi:hypothetical protein
VSEKTILSGESPKSQSIEAVRALLSACGKPVEKMPDFYRLSEDVVLVLSAKTDCYYTVTREHGCSCPSSTYRPGLTCKHQRKYLGMKDPAPAPEPLRPSTRWAGGHNGPVLEVA